MDKRIKTFFGIIFLMLISATLRAQETVPAESNDFMRSNGKIYVVIAVVVTILLGLFFYVFSLDRKISKLERKEN